VRENSLLLELEVLELVRLEHLPRAGVVKLPSSQEQRKSSGVRQPFLLHNGNAHQQQSSGDVDAVNKLLRQESRHRGRCEGGMLSSGLQRINDARGGSLGTIYTEYILCSRVVRVESGVC
jgi:hypothetical protein